MPKDMQHKAIEYKISEIDHLYGPNVHILSNPLMLSLLGQMGQPTVFQPLINSYVQTLYSNLLFEVVNYAFPRESAALDTRMKEQTPLGVWEGEIIDRKSQVICVDLARAGTWPSHICFDFLNYHLEPHNLRQDHYYLNRKTNEKGEVIGVDVSGSKIGGGKDNAIVLFPDPMGATGGSTSNAISYYKDEVPGTAKKFVAMHLVITPEYIARMKKDHPDVEIFAVRLDRGASDSKTLESIPGTHPEKEKGLNEIQYIVPGLGGVGEILNNAFV
jgi:uracil phosphoribosyltransferase